MRSLPPRFLRVRDFFSSPSTPLLARAAAATHASSKEEDRKQRTLEEIYQRKTPIEHVLLRPGMYVGSTDTVTEQHWIVAGKGPKARMVRREVTFVPALYKIFDEILVNAADNLERDPRGMSRLCVDIDAGEPGRSLPRISSESLSLSLSLSLPPSLARFLRSWPVYGTLCPKVCGVLLVNPNPIARSLSILESLQRRPGYSSQATPSRRHVDPRAHLRPPPDRIKLR